ncbi:MAG: hypothetical protein KA945_04865 [Zoogloea sp.]|nr:hypothetical protein [Zoogloea sp.]
MQALGVGADRVDTIRAEIPPVARRLGIQGAARGFSRHATPNFASGSRCWPELCGMAGAGSIFHFGIYKALFIRL